MASELACPRCRAKAIAVIDSRVQRGGGSIRRRRYCKACGYRYTTVEITEDVFKSLMHADALEHQRKVIAKVIADLQPLTGNE